MKALRLPRPIPLASVLPRLTVPHAARLFACIAWRGANHAIWRISLRVPGPAVITHCGGLGISQVPREPQCAFALLLDPGRTLTPGRYRDARMLLPHCRRRKLTTRVLISGLNHTAFAPAVYASCRGCPTTTQDSLPAGGQPLPDGIDYPLGSDERFQINYHPPFLSFTWRDGS